MPSAVRLPRAARRIVSSGASRPVQIRSEAAPWWTRTSRPSTTRAPRLLAAAISGVADDPYARSTTICVACNESARRGSGLRSAGWRGRGARRPEADRGAVDQQVVVGQRQRLAADAAALVGDAELGGQRLGPRGGPVPHRHRRTGVAERPDGGARGAAGAQDQGPAPAGGLGKRGDQAAGVGVLGLDSGVREGERVRGADRARSGRNAVGNRQRRELVRDGDVDPGEALIPERAHPVREILGRHLDRLIAPLVGEAELGERGVLHRRRA